MGLGCLIVLSTAPNISAEDSGSKLLNSLKERSPAKRWRKRVTKKNIAGKKTRLFRTVDSGSAKSKGRITISDQYPLILKPSRLSNNIPKIQHVSQLEDDEFSDATSDYDEDDQKKVIKNPNELRKITDIEPFYDYFPDKKEGEDPCRYICPRPDNIACKTSSENNYECPEEVKLSQQVYDGRHFGPAVFHWEASNLKHNPLYFEDAALERYGHTWPAPIQPFISTGKFGLQLVGLPYQMTLDPVHKDQYTLGWYRPGECAPKKIYQIPLNAKAAAVQAGVVTGLIFLVP